MLPGHEYRCSALMFSAGISPIRLPSDRENASTKCQTSTGSEQLFTGSRFAQQEDGRVGRGHLACLLERAANCGAPPEDRVDRRRWCGT
jgi:hypothetical protein